MIGIRPSPYKILLLLRQIYILRNFNLLNNPPLQLNSLHRITYY